MRTYDHIVIGAGSGGCAAAARLSEDPDRQVLLLEAGGSDLRLEVRAPLAFSKQFHTKGDWDYSTEPEPGCEGRRIYEPRGKVLGGSSAMNAMLWVRGCREDYDGWGIPGWSWDEVEPFFRRMEDRHLGDAAHGRGGPVHVTRVAHPDPVAERFVEAAAATGIERSDDLSGPELAGTGISPVTVWHGRRWSAARGYLAPAKRRKNLTVIPKALVRRIVIRDGRALGVEWERRGRRGRGRLARRHRALRGRVRHSAPAPALGSRRPASTCARSASSAWPTSPAVGANLTEHPLTLVNWELQPGNLGLSDATHPRYLLRWLAGGSGKLSSNIAEALAHVRSLPELQSPDFQLLFGPAFFWRHGSEEHPTPAMVIAQSYWTPASRGWVRARSPDPREKPAVQLNLLSERADVEAIIRAIRRSREIAATEPLASVAGAEIHPGAAVQTDAELEAWIRRTCEHTYHPSCTARMGQPGEGVLDPQLRVHGVAGLRVADASALPAITRANTNAPSILMGERVAEFLRGGAAEANRTASRGVAA